MSKKWMPCPGGNDAFACGNLPGAGSWKVDSAKETATLNELAVASRLRERLSTVGREGDS